MPNYDPNEDDDIDPGLTGEEFIEAVKAKKESKQQMPQMPEAPSIPNPAIAQVKKSPARLEIERIEEEKQAAKDAEELKRLQFYEQLEKDHPTLVKIGRGIKRIAGATSRKIDSAGGRFIQDQDAADRVMRKSSIPKQPSSKKKKESEEEEEEYEEESGGSPAIGGNKKFPFREFDSGSSLPKAAYLPKNQFGKEYKSVGVPVTLRMTGSQNKPSGLPGGMPELPTGGKKGKKGDKGIPMLDDHMRGDMSGQSSDNSGMGEYRSPKVPVTLGGGVAMGKFKGLGVPNSLSGVTLGGLGAPTPKVVVPVMTKENITMPNTIPLKKKGK